VRARQEAAGMLAVAAAPAQGGARPAGGPDAAERCTRAAALLTPAAGAALPERDAGDAAWPERPGGAAPLEPGPEWLVMEGCSPRRRTAVVRQCRQIFAEPAVARGFG
jgi:hypothetical protein